MELNQYFYRLIQINKEFEALDFFLGKAELSKTEFRLVREVIVEREKGKDIISSELARRLKITRSAVSQIVTKLEEKNIVRRTAAESDRKIAYIKLSDYASSLFEEQCRCVDRFIGKAVERFGEERLEKLFTEYDELLGICNEIKKEYCAKEGQKQD